MAVPGGHNQTIIQPMSIPCMACCQEQVLGSAACMSYVCLHVCLCIRVCVQEGPGEAAVAALGEATETPERLWTAAMRANTAEEVAHLALQAHAAQVSPHASLCSSFLDVSQALQSCYAWLHKPEPLLFYLFHPDTAPLLAVHMCYVLLVTLTSPFCQFLCGAMLLALPFAALPRCATCHWCATTMLWLVLNSAIFCRAFLRTW